MGDEDVLLSRSTEKQIELRGPCPASTVAVLDAVSMSKGQTRTDLVNEILGQWAKAKAHEFNVVARVLRGNPDVAEALGVTMERASV